jgi:hypothetical protein
MEAERGQRKAEGERNNPVKHPPKRGPHLALALDGLDQGNTLANLGVLSGLSDHKILLATLDHRARVDLIA